MESVRSSGDRYNPSYSYQRIEQRKRRRNQIIFLKIMGSILIVLSIFIPFLLSDQDANGGIALIALVVSAVLLSQIGGCNE